MPLNNYLHAKAITESQQFWFCLSNIAIKMKPAKLVERDSPIFTISEQTNWTTSHCPDKL